MLIYSIEFTTFSNFIISVFPKVYMDVTFYCILSTNAHYVKIIKICKYKTN
jgi:hypothetical protein